MSGLEEGPPPSAEFFKATAALVLFLIAVVGGLLPVHLQDVGSKVVSCLNTAAGGVFFASAMVSYCCYILQLGCLTLRGKKMRRCGEVVYACIMYCTWVGPLCALKNWYARALCCMYVYHNHARFGFALRL